MSDKALLRAVLGKVKAGYRFGFPVIFRMWIRKGVLYPIANRMVRSYRRHFPPPTDPHIQAVMPALLGSGDCYVDVGANVGGLAVPAARLVGETGTVICFEPVERNFHRLQANLRKRKGPPKIVLKQWAVGDTEGFVTMYLNFWDGWHTTERGYNVKGGYIGTIQIEQVTLDEALADLDSEHVDLLKIDVEGTELTVLEGARSLFRTQRVRAAIVEIANPFAPGKPDNARAVFDFMQEHGYESWIIDYDFLMPWKPAYCVWRQDVLFAPKEREERLLARLREAGLVVHAEPSEALLSVLRSRRPPGER